MWSTSKAPSCHTRLSLIFLPVSSTFWHPPLFSHQNHFYFPRQVLLVPPALCQVWKATTSEFWLSTKQFKHILQSDTFSWLLECSPLYLYLGYFCIFTCLFTQAKHKEFLEDKELVISASLHTEDSRVFDEWIIGKVMVMSGVCARSFLKINPLSSQW
jgi:hypothetical protein